MNIVDDVCQQIDVPVRQHAVSIDSTLRGW